LKNENGACAGGTVRAAWSTALQRVLALCALLSGAPAFGTIAYVQNNLTLNTSGTASVAATFTSAQSVGDLNIVMLDMAVAGPVVQSVTDSQGNVYAAATTPETLSGLQVSIYYAKNILGAAANANTVTVTFSGTVPLAGIQIAEYSGLDPVNPLDVWTGSSGTGKLGTSGSVTTTNANDLLMAGAITENRITAASTGFTVRNLGPSSASIIEDQTVTATGTYSASITQSAAGLYLVQMVAFRASTTVDTASRVAYQYDDLSRLSQVAYTDSVTAAYTLDSAGNRTTVQTVSGVIPSPPATVTGTAPASGTVNLSWTASTAGTGAGVVTTSIAMEIALERLPPQTAVPHRRRRIPTARLWEVRRTNTPSRHTTRLVWSPYPVLRCSPLPHRTLCPPRSRRDSPSRRCPPAR
jgi:hypothetical protein